MSFSDTIKTSIGGDEYFGYLTCDRTAAGDEVYTPYYAVDPLLEFIPKDKTIWCPFDEEWSAFYQTFKRGGV